MEPARLILSTALWRAAANRVPKGGAASPLLLAGFSPQELRRAWSGEVDSPPPGDPFGLLNGNEAPGLAALRLVARLNLVKRVGVAQGLSYGHTFVTSRPSLIGTVTVGYGDGYNRGFSNKGWMSVRGTPCPVVGRVCMDQTLIDLTDHPASDRLEQGEEVLVLGSQSLASANSPGPDWCSAAAATGVTPAALLGSIGRRVQRIVEE